MDRERLAGGVGILACLVVLALVGAPYLVGRGSAVGTYYAVGFAGPPLVALFSVIAIIALAAGIYRRSDPAIAAGIAVTVGLFMALVSWSWALSTPASLVGGFTSIDAFRHHRFLLSLAALVVPAASAWYARTVL